VGSTTERRKHKRHQYEAFISHDILSLEVKPAGKIYNFSKQGLYFESNHNFLPLEEIFVEIIDHPRSSDTDQELLFDVEVIWRKKLPDAAFRYGYGAKFKFSNETIEHKIKSASFKKPPLPQPRLALPQPKSEDETDAREFPRKRCYQSIHFNHGNQVYKGWVTNISRGGAFINTRGKFSLGRKIRIVITRGETSMDLQRPGWIVRVNSEGFGVSFNRRSGSERRYDLDRRFGRERRKRTKPAGPGKKDR
jgi:Tfp pilus assembly protein PilZ